ncbi:hypothetical protein KP509_21G047800 [Ceratopteris richardii]|uniref:Cyclin N-terminal domain-containing protein n=2 Tax=Ceratopteris richardii TaxID=49495 RepID=A0A8T2SA26_CERRI|nr:hypothetical protein KP509_21G047800 [Ceratopteris richardii]
MYETRLQAAQDENKRMEGNTYLPKGTTAMVQNLKVHPAQANNRRTLGDIGNLVGALSARCIVSKDVVKPQENPAVNASEHVAKVERPITRKFGASLASNVQQQAQRQTQPCANEVEPECDPMHDEVPLSWRTKQRRTMLHSCAVGRYVSLAGDSQSTKDNKNLPQEHSTKVNAQQMLMGVKKKQILPEPLAETPCGGHEVEMEEAEEPLPNIDEDDADDPLAVVDYVEDMYSYYRKTEMKSFVPSDYMGRQSDINEKMRAILIDWLIEVHLKFKLMPETLYLTINLIDRYLACQVVMRKNLQLVGVTAMLLACKYEEIWAPLVNDFVFISDKAYTREQVLEMEKHMLNKLRFNLTVPTPYVFLVRFLKAAHADIKLEMTAHFLVELCLTEYRMVGYCPSLLAAAAVYTAQHTLNRTPCWSTVLERHTGYTEMHLRDCAMKMVGFHKTAGKGNLTVVHKKYSNVNFQSVANLSPAVLPM